jgi:hypothetical protein
LSTNQKAAQRGPYRVGKYEKEVKKETNSIDLFKRSVKSENRR